MNEDEMIWDLEKYVSLMEAEYCDECNELNVISGKFCNGSRNVGLAVKTILDLYNKQNNMIDLMVEHIYTGCDFDNNIKTREQIREYFKERCK